MKQNSNPNEQQMAASSIKQLRSATSQSHGQSSKQKKQSAEPKTNILGVVTKLPFDKKIKQQKQQQEQLQKVHKKKLNKNLLRQRKLSTPAEH